MIIVSYNRYERQVFILSRTTVKTANIYTRVDPETKEQAESILNELGIPVSNAIGMFLKQVVIQRGIPFEVKLPSPKPVAIGGMTKEQIDVELQKGLDDIEAGRVVSADDVEAQMAELYGCMDIARQLEDDKE